MISQPSFLLPGTVSLNGQREALPVVTGDLVVRRASSSFLLIQAFGAQLLWHLEGPLALITLQPSFAHKVTFMTLLYPVLLGSFDNNCITWFDLKSKCYIEGAWLVWDTKLELARWLHHSGGRRGEQCVVVCQEIHNRILQPTQRSPSWCLQHIHPEETVCRDTMLRHTQSCLSGNLR